MRNGSNGVHHTNQAYDGDANEYDEIRNEGFKYEHGKGNAGNGYEVPSATMADDTHYTQLNVAWGYEQT